jgi:hypothetical protein
LVKAGDWKSLAWQLERAYPAEFARPEVALNLAMQNNLTQNYLSISITGEQAREIESQANPVRESVAAMFERYRPALSNGEGGIHEVEATASHELEQRAEGTPIIGHKVGDEKRQAFWQSIVRANPEETLMAQETALFVCQTILAEVLGFRATGAKIEFKDNPVRLSDVLGMIDRACEGPAGWQLLQSKAGYTAST